MASLCKSLCIPCSGCRNLRNPDQRIGSGAGQRTNTDIVIRPFHSGHSNAVDCFVTIIIGKQGQHLFNRQLVQKSVPGFFIVIVRIVQICKGDAIVCAGRIGFPGIIICRIIPVRHHIL